MNNTSKVGLLAGMMVLTVLAVSGNATAYELYHLSHDDGIGGECGTIGGAINCAGGGTAEWTADRLEMLAHDVREAGCSAFGGDHC